MTSLNTDLIDLLKWGKNHDFLAVMINFSEERLNFNFLKALQFDP